MILSYDGIDIADTRAKLELYAGQGQIVGHADLVGRIEAGEAPAIANRPEDAAEEARVESLDAAAMEFGTD